MVSFPSSFSPLELLSPQAGVMITWDISHSLPVPNNRFNVSYDIVLLVFSSADFCKMCSGLLVSPLNWSSLPLPSSLLLLSSILAECYLSGPSEREQWRLTFHCLAGLGARMPGRGVGSPGRGIGDLGSGQTWWVVLVWIVRSLEM
jgi:hypothetical protein